MRKLIAGPGVLICNRCVDLGAETVAAGGQRSNELTLLIALGVDSPKVRCSFCARRRDRVSAMVLAPLRRGVGRYAKRDAGVRICNDCLKLCDEILTDPIGA